MRCFGLILLIFLNPQWFVPLLSLDTEMLPEEAVYDERLHNSRE